MLDIPNWKLKLKDIPLGYDIFTWEDFALSFNGYKYGGGVEEIGQRSIAIREDFEKHNLLPDHLTLSELRMLLFFEQRATRHNQSSPSPAYIEALYESIRKCIKEQRDNKLSDHKQSVEFRVYNKPYTLFDLVEGDTRETKQTKGLAYLFSQSTMFLKKFLKAVLSHRGVDFDEFDYILVQAEETSKGPSTIRRDISIACYKKNHKKLVVVIEAKSINVSTPETIKEQLLQYKDSINFPNDQHIPIFGIALTRDRAFFGQDSDLLLDSITWEELMTLLYEYYNEAKEPIVKEYLDFLGGINGGMKIYEQEVVSIAGQDTMELLEKYKIYATRAGKKPLPRCLYLALRRKHGVMDRLYRVEEVFVSHPLVGDFSFLQQNIRERVEKYVAERKNLNKRPFQEGAYRFYILSETDQIPLPHLPKADTLNGMQYFKLSDLLN